MRKFPNPNLDVLKSFVVYTNMIERIPSNLQIVEKAIKDGKDLGDPYAVGQFTAINNILKTFAHQDNLIPNLKNLFSEDKSHDSLLWVREIHSMIMTPIMNTGLKTLQPDAPLRHQVGTYRTVRKTLGRKIMPNPTSIKKHMHNFLLSLSKFNEEIDIKIKNPFMLSKMDIQSISEECYNANLKICCIKPFYDGSNRTARLVENTLRLYWGLPWKNITIEDKDKYMSDIFKMQEKYAEN